MKQLINLVFIIVFLKLVWIGISNPNYKKPIKDTTTQKIELVDFDPRSKVIDSVTSDLPFKGIKYNRNAKPFIEPEFDPTVNEIYITPDMSNNSEEDHQETNTQTTKQIPIDYDYE